MSSRYPCFECGQPFDDKDLRDEHHRIFSHGFDQVQLDAVDRARWGVMGDDAPEPVVAHAVVQRRRLHSIPGGRK